MARPEPQQLASGLLLVAIGGFFSYAGRGLSMTESGAMGAGYLPRVLAGLLVVLGLAVIAVHGFRKTSVPTVPQGPVPWRAMLLLTAALIWFAVTVRPLGLGPALAGTVALSCLASPRSRWRPALLLTAGLVLFCWLSFVVALRMPVQMFGPVLR